MPNRNINIIIEDKVPYLRGVLDAYATVNSHPLAICSTALCVDDADGIVGNNDDYRMGALAYKVMTKGAVA